MHVAYLNYKHTEAHKLMEQHPEEIASPANLYCNKTSKLVLQPKNGERVWLSRFSGAINPVVKWFHKFSDTVSTLSNIEAAHFCSFSFSSNCLRFDSFEFRQITGKPDSVANGHNELPLTPFLSSNWAISFYETRSLLSLFGVGYPETGYRPKFMHHGFTHFQWNSVTFFEGAAVVTRWDQTHKRILHDLWSSLHLRLSYSWRWSISRDIQSKPACTSACTLRMCDLSRFSLGFTPTSPSRVRPCLQTTTSHATSRCRNFNTSGMCR